MGFNPNCLLQFKIQHFYENHERVIEKIHPAALIVASNDESFILIKNANF